MDVLLVMFKANGKRHDFPVTKSVTIMGRGHGCGLRIPLSSVSREHCQVEIRDDGLWLSDLGSSNGTFYNGNRIIETKLDAGDTFTLGPVHFTVVIDGVPSSVDPVRTVLEDDEPAAAVKHGKSSSAFASDDSDDSLSISEDGLLEPADIGEDSGVAAAAAKPAKPTKPAKEEKENDLKFLDEDEGGDELILDDEDEAPKKPAAVAPAPAAKKPSADDLSAQLDDSNPFGGADDSDFNLLDDADDLPKAKVNVSVAKPSAAPIAKEEEAEQSDTIPFDDIEDLGKPVVDDEEHATAKTISLSAEESGGMLAEAGLLDDEAALNPGKKQPPKPATPPPAAKKPAPKEEEPEIDFGGGDGDEDPLSALEALSSGGGGGGGGVDDSDAFDLLMNEDGGGEQEDLGGFILEDEDESK